jgi:LPS-assembly lipoprotein
LSFDRCISCVAAILLLALTACGFQPLYGNRSLDAIRAEEGLARVSVGVIADRTGQMLRNELDVRLDPNNQNLRPLYNLSVTLTESIASLAVRRDASATRANLKLTAQYSLKLSSSSETIYSGTVRSLNSYDILGAENEFSNLTARDEARRRAARDLADQIALRIALALENKTAASRSTK